MVRTPSCDDIMMTPDAMILKSQGTTNAVSRNPRDLIDFHGSTDDFVKIGGISPDPSNRDNKEKFGTPARTSKMKMTTNSDPKKKSPIADDFLKFDNYES